MKKGGGNDGEWWRVKGEGRVGRVGVMEGGSDGGRD